MFRFFVIIKREPYGFKKTCALSCLIAFYRGNRMEEGALIAERPGGGTYAVKDDAKVLEWFLANRVLPLDELVAKCAANADFWGEDIRAYL